MLGTLDSSCSQVSTSKIISTSFEIQLSLGPLFHGKPRQFQERIRSMFNCYWLLYFWFLSRIKAFLFLITAHFPSFLASFTFWTSFLNSAWSSGMQSSFMNIPIPFRLEVLLSMSYLWSVELTFMRISLPLFSVNLSNLFASMRHSVSICNLLCNYFWAKAKVSSSTSSFKLKIIRFKTLLLRSWSYSINFFISSLIGLIFNLSTTLFRVRWLLTFSSSSLIVSFILRLSKVSTSPCWDGWLVS